MNQEEATVWLTRRAPMGTPPELTAQDIEDALKLSRTIDSEGRPPSSPDWVPTFDVWWALSILLDLKADLTENSNTGGVTSFSSEGSSFTRSAGTSGADWRAAAKRARRTAAGQSGVTILDITPTPTGILPRSGINRDTSHDHAR